MAGERCPTCGVRHRKPDACLSRIWRNATRRLSAEERARVEAAGRRWMQTLAAGGAVEVGR